jgi:hypothetical protein
MVKATRLSVVLAKISERLVGQLWRHGPGAENIVQFSTQHSFHEQSSPNMFVGIRLTKHGGIGGYST